MKKIVVLISFFSVVVLLGGCAKQNNSGVCTLDGGSSACANISGTIDRSDFTGAVNTVLSALKHEDFATLVQFVGPQGIRFSPYEYVNTGTDVILDKQIIENALTISRSYVWGISDGKGDPIDLGIGQYFEKFVNDADYATAPEVLYNQSVQRGNTINNIAQVYQGKSWVEYYFSGFDAQYEGMDWKSLTLVFEQENEQRYLIGIIHGQRTI